MGWYYYDDDEIDDDDYTLSDHKIAADAIVIDGPVRAVSRRGPIGVQWWGQQWVQAMERLGHGGRLDRGKRYARNGSVLRLEIEHGMIYADVQGSRSKPYRTAVHFKIFDDEEWERALKALSEQAIYAAKLLAGEMPGDIEGVFQGVGLSLFPRDHRDIMFECSCPDWGEPCKHAAALYYLVAEQLDANPFVAFHLRGRSREAVLSTLRQHRGGTHEPEPTQAANNPPLDVETFWQASVGRLVRSMPVKAGEPFVYRQLGAPPNRDLGKIYAEVSDQASNWLGLDNE